MTDVSHIFECKGVGILFKRKGAGTCGHFERTGARFLDFLRAILLKCKGAGILFKRTDAGMSEIFNTEGGSPLHLGVQRFPLCVFAPLRESPAAAGSRKLLAI